MSYYPTSAPPHFTRSAAARPRDLAVPRRTSSAETSIDEDTADRLLVNGFSVPASPNTSQRGAMTYARPTSSAFDSQSRSPSLASSSLTPPSRTLTSTPHSLQHSIATNPDPDPGPPSMALLRDQAIPYALRPVSAGDSTTRNANGNPFVDPKERGFPFAAEKQPPTWPMDSQGTPTKRKGKFWKVLISLFIILLLLSAAMIPVGFFVLKPIFNKKASSSSTSSSSSSPSNSSSPDDGSPNDGPAPSSSQNGSGIVSVPPSAVGTVLDSSKWLDKTDFNLSYTSATVGGLSVMGLNSTWDDSTQANPNVPPLTKPFPYGKQPIKGISIGGWLVLEPYITPSLFSSYPSSLGVVDEWTLSAYLGRDKAAVVLETHYAYFITKSSFQEMKNAGFDHIRISFPYWIIENVNPSDPYVEKVGWRYLLRAIEYAREFGLRINLCLHAAPGSQNGFNHSGRQGTIGWLNGPNGTQNADLTTEFLTQLATFFNQPRYVNVVTMFSILNEPDMLVLNPTTVNQWSKEAYAAVRKAGFTGSIVISDGFLAPASFIGVFPQATYPGLTIDMHSYVIFNAGNLAQTHQEKWSQEVDQSINPSQGFGGPTIVGEWSIADTDCAVYLNSIGEGTRWEGTFTGSNLGQPGCPNATGCSCTDANVNASDYSDIYKTFLSDFFIAQTTSHSVSWGWFYWTWDTENATQWSYKKLVDGGVVSLQQNDFTCSSTVPDFQSQGLPEKY